MEDKNNYQLPFSDYLENSNGKAVAAITKSQYAIIKDMLTHDDMIIILKGKIRPDVQTDEWGNALDDRESFMNSNIMVIAEPGHVIIELPYREMLSNEQFECLKTVIADIKNYKQKTGKDYELNVYGTGVVNIEFDDYIDRIDELLNKLKTFVKEPDHIDKEVIIGKALIPIKEDTNEEKSKEETRAILIEEVLTEWFKHNSVDWDNDFPVYNEGENKRKGYSTILILTLITGIISIVILVLGMIINTL